MKALLTQIRREFWEHGSLWIVPLAIAVAMLLATAAFGRIQFNFSDPGIHPRPPIELMVLGWAAPLLLAAALLGSGYLIDCLYGERRERSILFWRSMPASDASTVLVKLLTGLVLVPLGAFVIAAAVSLAGSATLVLRNHEVTVNGQSLMALWNLQSWLRMQGIVLYGLIAALLWYAPFAAYLMLASVWARRSPYLWVVAPPLLLLILEHMVFGSNYVGRILGGGFHQLLHLAYRLDESGAWLSPERLLASPRLWIGLLAAALMVVLAIRVRRYRDEN